MADSHRNRGTFLYKLLKCLLRFGNPPSQTGYCICVHFIRATVQCRGPPEGGGLAMPRHSSSLHQRPPRSAILGLSTLHKCTAAQRVRGEGRDGRWRRLREIVSKSGIRGGENEWGKGGAWDCVCVFSRMRACMCVHLTVPLHACTCFPVCTMCVFAHFAAMPTTLRAPAQLE